MTEAFKKAIVRVLIGKPDNYSEVIVVGSGFLVEEHQVITCAHVVRMTLKFENYSIEVPDEPLMLEFPFANPGKIVHGKVTKWYPPQRDGRGDFACLAITDSLPEGACPTPLTITTIDEVKNHRVSIYGFPTGFDQGLWSSDIHIVDELANGRWQIEGIRETGRPIEPGFSGALVWDEKLKGVVGMVVTADKQARITKTAFIIPADILGKYCQEITSSLTAQSPKQGVPMKTPIAITMDALEQILEGPDDARYFAAEYSKSLSKTIDSRDGFKIIIMKIVVHCDARGDYDKLWALINGRNPTIYQNYYPEFMEAKNER